MVTNSEIAAFENFKFRVGQKVKSKHAGYRSGFVAKRILMEDEGGIHREYAVRHSATEGVYYREYELEETP